MANRIGWFKRGRPKANPAPEEVAPVLAPGESWRTRCGSGRVAYRPDWDAAKPYATYYRGTAGAHASSMLDAQTILRGKGCRT